MFPRKQTPPIPLASQRVVDDEKPYYDSKNKQPHLINLNNPHLRYTAILFLFLFAWLLVLLFWFPPTTTTTTNNVATDHHQLPLHKPQNIITHKAKPASVPVPTCSGGVSVYVYDLPAEFNVGLLQDCRHLNIYTDMCPHVANCGLGQPISNVMGSGSASETSSWFATHQFIGEMIFHARMENHPCRTLKPHRADLFYVPFYGGLHASSKFRESNLTERDALAVKLVDYIQGQPWWRRNQGRDHFMALSRTAWDFMRTTDGPDFGANCLLNLPAAKNMSVLTVERQPWQGDNQHGMPYPSYFHPSSYQEVVTWQNRMRQSDRPHLFSFIGAPRKGLEKAAIRDELIKQCGESTRCELLQCVSINGGSNKCHEPSEVLNAMSRSEFCLQAPGDSFTRRSTFDSVLAGCIPVFFSRHTAYTQYAWFLPEDVKTYSVFIDEKSEASKRIEEELLKIPREKVEKMRETVIRLIPRLTYAHPNATDVGFMDAVDVAIAALAKHTKTNKLLNIQY
ncbi:hypothetical protein FNV43_RR19338 [Rhamnella rubrinervis]|uniref:Exostosin GT47 domain-containing protein n=1 Tax=Rhamnella rubrinervis TaxID=2594499 RepID=A0A8K0EC64_9ROSA|nr:hypothetical protein FNV43_RR19338 [Rhamnella rubrinervis]